MAAGYHSREMSMDRRELLKDTGLMMGALMLPAYGRVVAAEVLKVV